MEKTVKADRTDHMRLLVVYPETPPQRAKIMEEYNNLLLSKPQVKDEIKQKLAYTSPVMLKVLELDNVRNANHIGETITYGNVTDIDIFTKDDLTCYFAINNAIQELKEKGYFDMTEEQARLSKMGISIGKPNYDDSILEEIKMLDSNDLVVKPKEPEKAEQKQIAENNVRLFVPVHEKDEAKKFGAKWNADDKFWYAPKGVDLEPFKNWLYDYDDKFKLKHIENFSEFLKSNGINIEAKDIVADGKLHFLPNDDRAYQLDLYDLNNVRGFTQVGEVGKESLVEEYNRRLDYASHEYLSSLNYIPPINWAERAEKEQAEKKVLYDKTAQIAQAIISVAPKATDMPTQHPYLVKKGLQGDGLYIVPSQRDLPKEIQDKVLIAENPYQGKQNIFAKKEQSDRYYEQLRQYDEHIKGLKKQGVSEDKYPKPPEPESLVNKQLLIKGDLLIPAYNINGEVRTLQYIHESSYFSKKHNKEITDSGKFYLNDGEKTGSMHFIGKFEDGKPVAIAEGWATGKAINDNFKIPVVLAFDTGGLEKASQAIREKMPNSRIYFFADNDWENAIKNARDKGVYANAGVDKATQASRKVDNSFVIVPSFNMGIKEESLARNPCFDLADCSIKAPNSPVQKLNRGTDWDDLIRQQGFEVAKFQISNQVNEINARYGRNGEQRQTTAPIKTAPQEYITMTVQGTTEKPDPNVNPLDRMADTGR